jgi:hypothetical protein
MIKIPYGLSDFSDVMNDNYFYADKTKYIELLEDYGEKYIFLLRPRRFGKTLFLSTLEHYYDIQQKENFSHLFDDLYIGKNKTELANNYYILKFDFSGVRTDSKTEMKKLFNKKVKKGIKTFIDKYNFDIQISKSGEAAGIMHDFNAEIANILRQKEKSIYLLIDEYDHFANDILSKNPSEFQKIVGQAGSVRIFFEALKEATADGIISRMFVTGVSPIALDSMTSGFNIESNLTTDPNFNQAFGFTAEEIKPLLSEIIPKSQRDHILSRLHEYYNGYLFSKYADKRVFNSDMILYYFNSFKKLGHEADELIDSSISSDYSKLQKLFSLKNRKRNYSILEDILAGNEQMGKITGEFNLKSDFSRKDFLSLLFYLGFLTIDREEDGFIYFRVPNYAVKEIYFDYFTSLLDENSSFDSIEIEAAAVEILKNGKINNFIEKIENALASLSNRDYISFDEKYIKVLIFSYLNLTKLSIVKSEYEVENGYLDIALLRRDKTNANYDALIELKYIKKKDFDLEGKKLIQEKLEEAKNQLLSYSKAEEFKDRKDLKKWAIIFVGNKATIEEL